jgi:hypothetical protein
LQNSKGYANVCEYIRTPSLHMLIYVVMGKNNRHDYEPFQRQRMNSVVRRGSHSCERANTERKQREL